MIQILVAFLSLSISHAKVEDVADKILKDCERILSETRQSEVSIDQMVDYLAWFEANLILMETNQVPKTEEIRKLYNITEHQVFEHVEGKPLDPIVVNVRRLSDKMRHFVAKAVAAGPLKIAVCINDLIEDPRGVRSDTEYSTGSKCEIKTVEFWPDAIKDMHHQPDDQIVRFLRAIRHGWARIHGQSGLKRIPDFHFRMVEVKDVTGPWRLLGCVDGDRLTIHRLIRKSDGENRSLWGHKDLCN